MEFVDGPNLRLDHVPKHCAARGCALWAPQICNACHRASCLSCAARGACPAAGCGSGRMAPCPTLGRILAHNAIKQVGSATADTGPRMQYTEDVVTLSRADVPTECPVCLGALWQTTQCAGCGNVVCGPCSRRVRQCPFCRMVPTWVALLFVDLVLGSSLAACTVCRKWTGALEQTHRCAKRQHCEEDEPRTDDEIINILLRYVINRD